MKRLFQVNKPGGKAFAPDGQTVLYFEDKPTAKRERDALNREHPKEGYTVSPGPDHKGLLPSKGRSHTRAKRIHDKARG